MVNNWNPWIVSNWLTAALLLEKDAERRDSGGVHKTLRCLDNFLDSYPRGRRLRRRPGLLGPGRRLALRLPRAAPFRVQRGTIDVFDQPLIREIGRYISRAHIAGPYSVNFADAAAKCGRRAPP